MEPQAFFKHVIDFQKTSFDTIFDTVEKAQEKTESIMGTYMDHSEKVSQTGKQVIEDWIKIRKTARDNWKKAVDSGYSMFNGTFPG